VNQILPVLSPFSKWCDLQSHDDVLKFARIL
jgi:hypothetical protein